MPCSAKAEHQVSGLVTSAVTTERRSAAGAKYREAAVSNAAESNTTTRAPGSLSNQCRANTLMTKPVPPVTSNVDFISGTAAIVGSAHSYRPQNPPAASFL